MGELESRKLPMRYLGVSHDGDLFACLFDSRKYDFAPHETSWRSLQEIDLK